MANAAPAPFDVLDFQFKLHCRLKIFENSSNDTFNDSYSILACASRFGLIFVGTPANSFEVIQQQDIVNQTKKDVQSFPRRIVEIPSRPLQISINCDCTKLCVVFEKDGCPTGIIYDVLSFYKQNIVVIKEFRLSATPNVKVLVTDWNPALPDIFTACKSDGSLGVYEFKGESLNINELATASNSTCFCWSPKGKQIAVGSRDGKITQYKPDLKAVKVVNAPPLEGNLSIISLQWASSFQFIGIYKDLVNEVSPSSLIVIDVPKGKEATYTNYEDVCYSYGNNRPQQFYMTLQQHWNILMVSSSNSTEVGVMGLDGDKWMQWILEDSSRAELPIINKQDSVPVGTSLYTGSVSPASGETPMPMLLLLAHQGVLCCFNVVNLKPGAVSICSPPDPVADKSGLNFYVQPVEPKAAPILNVPKVVPTSQFPIQTSAPVSFTTTEKNAFSFQTSQPSSIQQTFNAQNPTNTFSSIFGKPTESTPMANQQKPVQSSLFGTPNVSSSNVSNIFGKVETTPQKSIQTTPQIKSNPIAPFETTKTPSNTQTQEIIKPKPIITPQIKTEQIETPNKNINDRIPVSVETEAMIAQLVKEECLALESELKALLHRGKCVKINIGNDNEASEMAMKAGKLEEFVKALKETSAGQVAEIHVLKQNVMQTWAWYEEARSRFSRCQDPQLVALLKVQSLDSASQRQLENLNHLIYYLDSQLVQVNKSLDEQWDYFQDSLKKNKKIRMPTMEIIYQLMVKQNGTLQKQKYLLKEIANRITLHKKNQTSSIFLTLEEKNVSSVVDELNKLQLNADLLPPVQYTKIFDRQDKLTKEKFHKLHKTLSKRNATNITISKPTLNNSTIHLTSLLTVPNSPQVKKNESLAEPLSPIAHIKPFPAKLDFGLCTPKVQDFKENKPLGKFASTSTPMPTKSIQIPTAQPVKNIFEPQKSSAGNILGTGFTIKQGTAPSFPVSSGNNKSLFGSPTTQAAKPFGTSVTTQNVLNLNIATTEVPKTPVFQVATTKISSISTTTGLPFGSSGSFNMITSSSSGVTDLMNRKIASTFATTKTTENSIFGATKPIDMSSTAQPSNKSAFSFAGPGGSIFGSSAGVSISKATTSSDVSSSTSIFGTSSILGTATTKVISSTPANAVSIFASATTLATSSSTSQKLASAADSSTSIFAATPSIFGTATSTPSANIFGGKTPPVSIIPITTSTTTKTNLFGSTSIVTAVASSTTPTTVASSTTHTTVQSGFTLGKSPIGTTIATSATPTTVQSGFTLGKSPTGFSQTVTTTTEVASTTTVSAISTKSITGSVTTAVTSQPFGATSNAQSIFGSTSTSNVSPFVTTTASTSIFSQAATSSASIFTASSTTSNSSIFGSTTSTSIFSGTAATTSIFGGTTTTTTASSPFGSTTTSPFVISTTVSSGSIFATPTTTTSSIFGGTATTSASPFGATTSSSPFGTTSTFGTNSTSQSPFGTATVQSPFGSTQTKTQSPFGAPATTASCFVTPQGGSVFGSAPSQSPFGTPTTTAASIFGSPTSSSSIFGQGTTSSTSVFGTPTTTQSPFGAPSTFGAQPASPFAGKAGPFGSTSSSGSIFGQPSTFGGGSIFGGTTTTASNNVFGNTTTTSSNVFGSGFGTTFTPTTTDASPFGSGSIFRSTSTSGTPFGTTTSAPFGQTTQTSSFNNFDNSGGFASSGGFNNANSFSFNNLNVGGAPTTTTTSSFGSGGFGQAPANPFGRASDQKFPTFSNASLFGSPSTTSSSVFGSSPFSKPAFGSAPTFGSPPAFGSQSTFGQPSTFGGSTFGSPQGGSFSAGGQSVQQSGFGSPSFQKPAASGFGSPPVFGAAASPGFGAPPSFGGPPAFGGAPAFGSPQKVFGGGTTTANATFGASQNASFGNLANQNTLGFGNLAQSTPTQQPSGFSGGSSFSSWR